MAAKPLPSPEVLRQLLRYEPDTGRLFWKERIPSMFAHGNIGADAVCRNWNARYAGKQAFVTRRADGYCEAKIGYQRILAHRVVWAMHHNQSPPEQIDHINGVRSDNRPENLRAADYVINSRNRGKRYDNSSGHPGVHFNKSKKKWDAAICNRGRLTHLGTFPDRQAAIDARKAAEERLGFHENHGSERGYRC